MSQTRAALLIALSMVAAAAAAWWRFALSGGLAPGPQLLTGAPALAFGLAMSVAAVAYLGALRAVAEPLTRRHLWLAFAVHLCAAPAPPFSSTDALMNLAYGRLANLGLNPYRDPPRALPKDDAYRVALDWPAARNAWGPLTVYVGRLAARAEDRRLALFAFKLLMLATTLLALAIAWAHSRARPRAEQPAFFFFACNPLLAWELSGQAHNDALLVAAATGFVWAASRRRSLLAFLCLLLGAATKYGLAPALCLYTVFLWRVSRRRLLLGVVAGGLAVAALWAPFLDRSGALEGLWIAALPNVVRLVNSPASVAHHAGRLLGLPLFALWTVSALALLAVLAARYAVRVDSAASVVRDSLSFTLLYQVLAMPSYWPWYATWLLPLGYGVADPSLRTTVALFTAFCPALYLTGGAGGLAILLVHGLALGLWLRASARDGARRRAGGSSDDGFRDGR